MIIHVRQDLEKASMGIAFTTERAVVKVLNEFYCPKILSDVQVAAISGRNEQFGPFDGGPPLVKTSFLTRPSGKKGPPPGWPA